MSVGARLWHPDRHIEDGALPSYLWPVLAELMSGATDATASRRLNMSARTFSRRVAELLDELGAQSRFQAGAQTVLRGWTGAGAGGPAPRLPGAG